MLLKLKNNTEKHLTNYLKNVIMSKNGGNYDEETRDHPRII